MIDDLYRKTFRLDSEYIVCDFSENIPAWRIDGYFNFKHKKLFLDCISYAEERKFYNFYNVIFLSEYEEYLNKIEFITDRYNILVEELIPSNEKSVNLYFWDWLLDNISHEKERLVIVHSLKQRHRLL